VDAKWLPIIRDGSQLVARLLRFIAHAVIEPKHELLRLIRVTLLSVALLECKSPRAAEPSTCHLHADSENGNSKIISGVALSSNEKLVAAAFGQFSEPLTRRNCLVG
jgi:hypothetical protein